jgi:hypothetical protein
MGQYMAGTTWARDLGALQCESDFQEEYLVLSLQMLKGYGNYFVSDQENFMLSLIS